MSRRTGQDGNVYQPHRRQNYRGKWDPETPCYGRYWADVPGNPDRVRRTVALGVCATRTLARLKLREFLEREGINSPLLFHQNTAPATTFAEQAEVWFERMRVRKRKPVKPKTLDEWRAMLDRWLIPLLGDMLLANVGNAALKTVIEKMIEKNLAAQTIVSYTRPVKMIVASALTPEGDEIYPRRWNHDFVGMPIINQRDQRRPTLTSAELEARMAQLRPREWMLVAIAAGTGLRRGELFGLKVGDFSPDCRVLQVRRSVYKKVEQLPKTEAALRPVDTAPELAEAIQAFVANKTGLLFTTGIGKPLMFGNVARSLRKAGFEGFHSLRRFRTERLRSECAPEDVIRLWLGHANRSITDRYAAGLAKNLKWRQEWCERVGLGFSFGLHGLQNVVSIDAARVA